MPPRPRLAVALLAAALLAGGAATAALRAAQEEGDPLSPLDVAAVSTHNLTGFLPDAPAAQGVAATLLPVGRTGGEPTVGVTSRGTLFVTGYSPDTDAHVYRSRDGGRTWQEVAQTLVPRLDVDPWLHVDPRTDRVFSAPLWRVCSHVLWSDDDGDTWSEAFPTGRRGGCGHHGQDHQALVTGPPPAGLATRGYPSVVYYSYTLYKPDEPPAPQTHGAYLARSLDGGVTWDDPVLVHPVNCQGGLAGPPAVAPDGIVYYPKSGCPGVEVGVSRDGGATWTRSVVGDRQEPAAAAPDLARPRPLFPNPGASADAAGNAFVVFTALDGRVALTRSTDRGASWSEPVPVAPPDVTATAFHAVVAGDAGRVAVAYLATTDEKTGWGGNESHHADADTTWHLYVTFSPDATQPDPVFHTLRVTPPDDPVQVGCVWQGGGGSGACRNLRDYLSIVERDGRAYVAFADGCLPPCDEAGESTKAAMTVAVVEGALLRAPAGTA